MFSRKSFWQIFLYYAIWVVSKRWECIQFQMSASPNFVYLFEDGMKMKKIPGTDDSWFHIAGGGLLAGLVIFVSRVRMPCLAKHRIDRTISSTLTSVNPCDLKGTHICWRYWLIRVGSAVGHPENKEILVSTILAYCAFMLLALSSGK